MPADSNPDPNVTVELPSPEAGQSTLPGARQPAHSTEPTGSAGSSRESWPAIPGYTITSEIARGGMGCVLAARELALDREVAIKLLLPRASAERFITEAKITARLPHPSIPPVHALGKLADSSPYLAMKLVRGRTLHDELKLRPTLTSDLPRFVQIFEQIAQAVGFAHSRDIIHRDLKPLNVMVGGFGEVQVMDWGLAKDIASVERESGESPADDNAQHTVAGSILGTPGYMAPEQARGEAVDARADVFALGSTLAVILTGKPAIAGTTVRETIDMAARADLADVLQRLDGCGADAELVALAQRCLAADRESRLADGRAVATHVGMYRAKVEARLHQAETERAEALVRESEQAKRRRVVQWAGGIVAAVLLTGLAASLWQTNRAIKAEKSAITERDAKDTALKAKTKALQEKSAALEAESLARAAERSALNRARKALRSLTEDVIEEKFTRGQGYTLTPEDRAFFEAVKQQWEALAVVQGDHVDSLAVRAEGRFRIGFMRQRLGELQEAEADFDAALVLFKRLAADFPNRVEFRDALAKSHDRRGSLLLDTGRPKEAELDYQAALAIRKELATDFPDRSEFRQDLAAHHHNRGGLLSETGRLKEAEADYRAALDIDRQLAADFPTNSDVRQELANSHNNRASLMMKVDRFAEAEADYDAALAIQKQLAAEFPTRPEFRWLLASRHNNRASLMMKVDRHTEAEADYRLALDIYQQLAADFPTRPEFRQELAGCHNNRGTLMHATGRLVEAEAEYGAALAIQKQLADDFPTRITFREELAAFHGNLGRLLSDMGRLKEAVAAYNAALDIVRQLAADLPTNPDVRFHLANSLNSRGLRLRDAGRLKEAEADYDAALDIYKQLAPDFPARPEFHQELAQGHSNRANLLSDTGRLKEAEADYDAALGIYDQLAAAYPNRANRRNFRQALGISHNSRGVLMHKTDRLKAAEADYEAALSIRKQLAAEFPNSPGLMHELSQTCSNRAILHAQQGNVAAAKRLLLDSRPHRLAAIKVSPKNPEYRESYSNSLVLLCCFQAGLLEPDEALRTAESRRDLGWDPPYDAADAAGCMSRCIPIGAQHMELDDQKRKEAAQFYTDAALTLLREAIGKGFQDAAKLKSDPAFAPLRENAEFRRLLANLEAQ